MSEELKRIREELRAKMSEREGRAVSNLPPRFNFSVGDELFAKIEEIRDSPFAENQQLYIVRNLDDDSIYRLPTHRLLMREMQRQEVREGDVVLIKLLHQRERDSEEGKRIINIYAVVKYNSMRNADQAAEERREYINHLLALYGGKIPESEFKYFVEEVKGWKVEEIIKELGLKRDGSGNIMS